jgi:hypothetical protein
MMIEGFGDADVATPGFRRGRQPGCDNTPAMLLEIAATAAVEK